MIKPLDYIVVGLGIAGISVCEELQSRRLTYKVFNTYSNSATTVAGGILNPTILKWFTTPPNIALLYPKALDFYARLESKLKGDKFYSKKPVYRIFTSFQEQNNWLVASDKQKTSAYFNPEIINSINQNIKTPYGLGEIMQTAQINLQLLINQYVIKLKKDNFYIDEKFDYNQLKHYDSTFEYKGFTAKYIIFCEGISVLSNPFFNEVSVKPSKGEYLIINAPDLKSDFIIKGKRYLIPLGNDRYKFGATFGNESEGTDWKPSQKAYEILKSDLKEMISCPFKIERQIAGIRPVTANNQPVIQKHSTYQRMAFFNGLGMRGLTTAPYYARLLIENMESDESFTE